MTANLPTAAGWQELMDSLSSLPGRMLAQLSREQQQDPQIQQEIVRLALASLASNTLSVLGGDPDAPQFLPALNQVLNVGQPNADTVYRTCVISADSCYAIRGRRGSLSLAVVSQIIPGTNDRPHLDLSDLQCDADGRYEVLMSQYKPAGYSGDWWPLHPAAVQIMARLVSADWGHEVEPTLTIERVDRDIQRQRTPAAVLEQRLRRLPRAIDAMALMSVGHFNQLRSEGYINHLKILTLEYGALAGQFYYEGTFDLAEDEALIIESEVPERCDYRSIILTNEIYETLDWHNNQSSLNTAQAQPDADGKLRFIVAARDPGYRNWLDTAGHGRGVVQGRWTGASSHPVPVVHKVKLTHVADYLPANSATVTPEERQLIIRGRRLALQERVIW